MRTESRPPAIALVLLTFAAVGAGVSALLLQQYLSPEGGACGPGGGCETVRNSVYASIAGIPVPLLGLLFFSLFGAALLIPRLRARRLPALLGATGGLAGLTFLGLQWLVIGAWCPYCVVADCCALGLSLAVFAPSLSEPRPMFRASTALAFASLGLALPMAIGATTRPAEAPTSSDAELPESIATEQVEGRATIVEFVDFECPFCRRQHERLSEILDDYGERVRVVYRHKPLSMHPHARQAARVACCAEEQGLGDAVADALMRSDDLSAEGCLQCARRAGVDPLLLDQCLSSERPDARLETDALQARAAEVHGLPTCFIGTRRFEGLQSEATLRDAIERALAG